ncbi:nose resistant to fluoxetine protein 6 isoform X2 [Harmonia axyridis]|uniref:nose resistant to fluoxetine protein 6 isoform X2 n=1 Tax=Harmonia axyridis TaxID=115357 RepID=UPI001E277A97|nr:nose resistant to fluoxetine protein 6 isoform X2 [Harmonia axyridis]
MALRPKEMEYDAGAVVEPKYFLPLVRLSVGGGNETVPVPASLSRMLNIFDTEQLVANWGMTKRSVSERCRGDVEGFIGGLTKGENWALKMEDASGKYSTGWFFGNHYWTGSRILCENIYFEEEEKLIASMNSVRVSREAGVLKTPKSPSQGVEYESTLGSSSSSPFPVGFFMLRLHLRTNFTTDNKIIHVGVCMPFSCTDDDVIGIVRETSRGNFYVDVEVEAIRSNHDKFDLWTDKTFIFLCFITSFTVIMLFIGTTYDFYSEYSKEQRRKKSAYNLVNEQLKIGMTESDLKSTNGKHGVYIINKSDDAKSDLSEGSNNTSDKHKGQSVWNFLVREVLMSFSIRMNMRIICDHSVGSDTIPTIHGLKSISMAWVILGHTCIIAFKYSDNMEFRRVIEKDFLFQTISNGAFSVDSFFFASGLLVSFLYFRTNAKGKLDPLTNGKKGFSAGFLHFFGLVFYRFLRLTVPYLVTLALVDISMKWFNYNSVFEPPTLDHVNCEKYWWRNILYINTLFPVEEMCMLWSWYLSDDTQFYVIGAVILILSTSHFKSAASVLLTLLVSSWMTTSYIAYSNSHRPGSDDPLALFDKIYDKPWTRLGPYLVGMSIGWFLFKKNCQLHMNKVVVLVGWTLSTGCLLVLVYGLYGVNLDPISGAAYSALSHSAWALGLGWIVVACSTGYGGIVNKILSAGILYPFSRVTYCAYLLHPIVIRAMAMSMDSPLHLGTIVMLIIFLGQVVASYSLAFFMSIAFEAPTVSMLRIMQKLVAFKKEQQRVLLQNTPT